MSSPSFSAAIWKRFTGDMLPYLFGFAALVVAWHILSAHIFRSALFPPPWPVFVRGYELTQSGELFEQIQASLVRILIGFFIGCAVGILVGLLMGSISLLRKLSEPIVETLRFIPAIAMITVAVIWFGIGESSKIFIVAYATVFIVIVTTTQGVLSIPHKKIWAARSMGATRAQVFFLVTLPAAVPAILTGMRVAIANAFITIVAAELIAADKGIGQMLWTARMFMAVDDIFVVLITLALLGFTADRVLRWAIFVFARKYSLG